MDSRIARRRRSVSEDRARRRLRWLLGLLLLAAAIGLAAWALRSPLLSIREITVAGDARSAPERAINGVGLETGTPTISVDAAALEQALLADPWIEDASVTVSWPGRVDIDIREHRPVAYVLAPDGWSWASADGHIVTRVEELPADSATVDITSAIDPGQAITDAATLGALEFLGGLSPPLAENATVVSDGGSLAAQVEGHTVRLGRPVDMTAKALALEALLATDLPPEADIDLIAPRRPAVANTELQPEGEAKSADTVQLAD